MDGRTVLVTGAASGIGLAAAAGFARLVPVGCDLSSLAAPSHALRSLVRIFYTECGAQIPSTPATVKMAAFVSGARSR